MPVHVDAGHLTHAPDIRIYSHSPLLYWWPVWVMGFLLAFWTWVDHYPSPAAADGQPMVHIARSPIPGAIFVITLLFTIVFSNVSLRGPWALFFGTCIVSLMLLLSWLHGWSPLFHWFSLLRIYLNQGGYLALAIPLCLVWFVAIFFFDRRVYIVFTAGQLRVCDRLGKIEQVYDAMSVAFEKKPYNWFHRFVGCGAGDLVLKAGGANREVYELPNVVRIASRLRVIEERLKTRDVE
jgi:hypothetical protein